MFVKKAASKESRIEDDFIRFLPCFHQVEFSSDEEVEDVSDDSSNHSLNNSNIDATTRSPAARVAAAFTLTEKQQQVSFGGLSGFLSALIFVQFGHIILLSMLACGGLLCVGSRCSLVTINWVEIEAALKGGRKRFMNIIKMEQVDEEENWQKFALRIMQTQFTGCFIAAFVLTALLI